MKDKQTTKIGFAIHCHHDILVERCYNYDERVEYIKKNKLENELKIRLRLFKILPKKSEKDIPERYLKAYAEWEKAYAEWKKANAEWNKAHAERKKADDELEKAHAEWEKAYVELEKAYAECKKADDELEKAYAEWKKADDEWPQESKDAFHKRWCGCKEWNGKKLIFQ